MILICAMGCGWMNRLLFTASGWLVVVCLLMGEVLVRLNVGTLIRGLIWQTISRLSMITIPHPWAGVVLTWHLQDRLKL